MTAFSTSPNGPKQTIFPRNDENASFFNQAHPRYLIGNEGKCPKTPGKHNKNLIRVFDRFRGVGIGCAKFGAWCTGKG